MAVQTGLGDAFYISGVDISGDTNSINKIDTAVKTEDVTGINKFAHERIASTRDGDMSFTTYFNPAAGQQHSVLKTLPTADAVATYVRGAGTLGAGAASLTGKQLDYKLKRGNAGSLLFDVDIKANGFGLMWGQQLTAGPRTDTTATNGTSLDNAASTAFGAQAFLHVLAFTGTSCTVAVQHSNDDAATDPYANVPGLVFVAASSAPQAQFVQTAAGLTIKRWLRVVTTGTFNPCTFVVAAARNEAAVTY